jgi:hypothetical protein
MADPADDKGVVDATAETVVLAFELFDAEVARAPERLRDALLSADVQTAIQKALDEFAKDKLKKTPTTVSEEEAKELGKKLLEAGKEGVVDNVTHQIKSTAKYAALDKSLKDLTSAIKKTPMGVWVDEHSTMLYIVGAGAVLGGAAAMYVMRSGDAVTEHIMPLVGGKSVSFKLLGKLKLDLGLDKLSFKPSERLIESKTFISAKWKQLELKLNMAVTAADGKFTGAVDGKIVVPISKDVKLQTGGGYDPTKKSYNLNITVGVDVGGGIQLGVMAGYGKGGFSNVPTGDAFRAIPEPSKSNDRPAGFIGLGISGRI